MSVDTGISVLDLEQMVGMEEIPNDPNQHAHIVSRTDNQHIWVPGMDVKKIKIIAALKGIEIVALCGYRWIPVRNPDDFPVCGDCMRIVSERMGQA